MRILDSAHRVERFETRTAQQSGDPLRKKSEKTAARRAKRADKQKEETKIS